MKTNKNELTVRIELAGTQRRTIFNWLGCDFSHALVSPFPGKDNIPKGTIVVKLASDQIESIEGGFSELGLTGQSMVVFPPPKGEVVDKPVRAVLEKEVHVPPPPPPPPPKKDNISSEEDEIGSQKNGIAPDWTDDRDQDYCCTTE